MARPPLPSLLRPEPPDNACRYAGRPGHVESYFVRANHPSRPLALWLKATLLAPLRGPAVAESWLVYFDGERRETFAHKQTQPFAEASFGAPRSATPTLRAAGLTLALETPGRAEGRFEAAGGAATVRLGWQPLGSPIAQRLSIFPLRALRTGPFPRSKLLTPAPALRLHGALELPTGEVPVDGWVGMQGHNWGKEHTYEYAWGQCVFPEQDALVEGFSGRVLLGGRPSPQVSALVVRRGARSFRFDTLFDVWRQKVRLERDAWQLRLLGPGGEAELLMDAERQPMVCLGYDNPDGQRSYCFNSKLARVKLTVRPKDDASFTCESAHGGALEFLRHEPDARFPHVV